MDVQVRLAQHNAGKTRFTKGHLPWKIIYSEQVEGRSEARAREKYLKGAAGKRYIVKQLSAD